MFSKFLLKIVPFMR